MRAATMALSLCLLMAQAAHAQYSGEVAWQGEMLLGRGYDTVLGAPREHCMDFTERQIPATAADRMGFDLDQLESTADLISTLNVSTSASVSFGALDASAEMAFARDHRITAYDANMAARNEVRLRWHNATDYRLKPQYAQLLNTSPGEFRSRCGDSFVSAVLYGGAFTGLVRASARTQAEYDRLTSAISASYRAFKGNGSFSDDTQSAFEKASYNVQSLIRGGDPNLPQPTNITELQTRARDFSAEVNRTGGTPISASFTSYSIEGGEPPALSALGFMGALYWEFESLAFDVRYALEHRAMFHMAPGVNWTQYLAGVRQKAIDAQRSLVSAIERCRSANGECEAPEGLPDPFLLRLGGGTPQDPGLPPLYQAACERTTIGADRLPRLKVYPLRHTGRGDTEMKGHNPSIAIAGTVGVDPSGKLLSASMSVRMVEDRPDWTTFAEDNWQSHLLNLAETFGGCVVAAEGVTPRDGRITANGGNNKHNWQWHGNGTGFLDRAECRSDTDDDDRGKLGCRTIMLRPIVLDLQHEETHEDLQASLLRGQRSVRRILDAKAALAHRLQVSEEAREQQALERARRNGLNEYVTVLERGARLTQVPVLAPRFLAPR